MSPIDSHKLAALAEKGDDHQLPGALSVPPIDQETDYSCGAAALLAVLRFHGMAEDEDEESLYGRLGTTEKDGTDPKKLASVANEYGLKANWRTGIAISDLRDAVSEGVPVILDIQQWDEEPNDPTTHLKDGHYVVLVGVGDDMVEYMDPSLGDFSTMTIEDLEDRWRDYEGERGGVFVMGLSRE